MKQAGYILKIGCLALLGLFHPYIHGQSVSTQEETGKSSLELGLKRFEQGELVEAEQLLSAAADSTPENAIIWFTLGNIRMDPLFKGNGKEEFKRAYTLEPGNKKYARALITVLKTDIELKENCRMQVQVAEAEKKKALERLSAGIAHDLKNIIGAISGFAEIALLDVHDKPVREDIGEILKASNRFTIF